MWKMSVWFMTEIADVIIASCSWHKKNLLLYELEKKMTQKDAELIMKTVPAEVLVNSNPDYCGAVQKKNNAGKCAY